MAENQVKVTLIVDEKGAVRALRTAGEQSEHAEGKFKKLEGGVKGLGKSFGGLKSIIGYGLATAGFAGVTAGLASVVSTTKSALDQTEKFSAISGIGAQQSLLYTSALKARGIDAEAAGKSFAFLESNLKAAEKQEHKFGMAQGKATAKGKVATAELGKQAAAFKVLFGAQGVGALAGLTGEQKLAKVVKAFEHLPPAIKKTGQQAALMKEVFGKGGLSLATVLEGGATGLTHFTEVAKRFMPEIKGGAKGIEEWQTKNSEFHMGLEGLELSLGMKLIPVLMKVETWFTKVSLEVKDGTGTWGKLGRAVSGVIGFLKGIWLGFEKIVGPANAVKLAVAGIVGAMAISKIAGFATALGGLSGGVNAAGGNLGGVFGKAFIAAAIAAGIYSFLKNTKTDRPLEEAFHDVFGGENKFEKDKKKREAAERRAFLKSPKHVAEMERSQHIAHANPFRHIKDPVLRKEAEHAVAEQHQHELPRGLHAPAHTVVKHEIHMKLSGDSALTQAMAKALREDTGARRELTEAVSHEAHSRAGRR
jgi:hypothetical protein